MSDDAFSDISWPVLSEEIIDEMDRVSKKFQDEQEQQGSDGGGPQLSVEVEQATDVDLSKGETSSRKSLYDLFRKHTGVLSVTDCTGPGW